MEHNSAPNFKKKKKKLAGIKNQMKHMSKEAIRAALVKKKKCNDRAIELVNLLIEPGVTEEFLLSSLIEINQSHFDDVIEERAICKICGYPLCSNMLKDVPMKQFHISTKTNKVYDITERKNFCSNLCYKAGKYLKDQLYTSPLWLREHEDPVVFKLLPLTVNSGSSGEEVDFGSPRLSVNDALGETSKSCEKTNETAENSDEEVLKEEMSCDSETADKSAPSESASDLSFRLEAMDLSSQPEQNFESSIKIIRESFAQECSLNPDLGLAQEGQAKLLKKALSPKEIIMKIENVMRSWFTFETYCFLLGEEKVRQELDSYGLQLQRHNSDPHLYDRYSDLCKRLNLLELEETYGAKEIESPKKPMPDFEKLRDESQRLEIKVKSFFKGNMEFEAEEAQEFTDEPLPFLPPLDHYASKAARRRIFLQKLYRVMPDIQEALGLKLTNISEQIKELASSLKLTAKNICLKPTEWNIVAIVLIKLLSIRDLNLKQHLVSKKASNYLELILMSYTLDTGYLDRLVCWLLDINYLIHLDRA